MYPFGRREGGMNRRQRDILLIAVAVLLVANIAQLIVSRTSSTDDSRLRSTFVSRMTSETESARALTGQLLRTGGSNTMKLLAQTRQYLYGVSQLNTLSSSLLGGPLTAQAPLDAAFAALDECEERLLSGLAIDTQLSTLRGALDALGEAVRGL